MPDPDLLSFIEPVDHTAELPRLAAHYRDLSPHVKERMTGQAVRQLLEHIRWLEQQLGLVRPTGVPDPPPAPPTA